MPNCGILVSLPISIRPRPVGLMRLAFFLQYSSEASVWVSRCSSFVLSVGTTKYCVFSSPPGSAKMPCSSSVPPSQVISEPGRP